MKNSSIYYSVGALLYCPANNTGIADSIINEKLGSQFSLALCLEDTIGDTHVAEAIEILLTSLTKIYQAAQAHTFYLPKIFIRIREPQQIIYILQRLQAAATLICGFILPKFSLENADSYIRALIHANESSNAPLYAMPIYENASLVHLKTRADQLYALKEKLHQIEPLVLNIRVGGNDLCHVFGLRRQANESIHQLKPVAAILADIAAVYGADYVVSGPVWDYYDGENWEKGLLAEIQDDQLCGFTGKTVIHPRQIAVVNRAYQVSEKDLADARMILHWEKNAPSLVRASVARERMNEYKSHSNWALRTALTAEVFGVKQGNA